MIQAAGNNYPSNRLRQLQGLVTIDAWHEGVPKSGRVDLHAYIYFDEARLGGQRGDEVAFRLQLRKAELKFLQSEPKTFAIDPGAIWRGDRDPSGKITRSIERRRARSAEAGFGFEVSTAPTAKVGGKIEKQDSIAERTEIVTEAPVKTVKVSFRRTDKDQPVWHFQTTENSDRIDDISVLTGQPWDDKTQKLLSLSVDRGAEDKEMLSSIRLCLICRREDLYFYDIKMRLPDGNFSKLPKDSPKTVIVQEYLKRALLNEGLPSGDMESPFSIIHLGEVVSEARSVSTGDG